MRGTHDDEKRSSSNAEASRDRKRSSSNADRNG
jgi:hypothetical protein